MVAVEVKDAAGIRDQIMDNVHFAFPYCFDTEIPDRDFLYNFEWKSKILVYHVESEHGYEARVFYKISESNSERGWKPWMDGGYRPTPKEALEGLLNVSAGVLEYLRNQKILPDWEVGESRKNILDGNFKEKPTK